MGCGVSKLSSRREKFCICRRNGSFETLQARPTTGGQIKRRDQLGGLIHEYHRTAA
jgi:hypothetical protein